jgi:hypothetical protein
MGAGRTSQHGGEDVVEADVGVFAVQEPEGDGEEETDEQHVRHELDAKVRMGKVGRGSEMTHAVAGTSSVQGLPEGTPSDGGAVEGLHLLPTPDVASLHILEDVVMGGDDDLHDDEVQETALRNELDGVAAL